MKFHQFPKMAKIEPEKTWNGDITLYVEPGLNTMEIKDIPFAQ